MLSHIFFYSSGSPASPAREGSGGSPYSYSPAQSWLSRTRQQRRRGLTWRIFCLTQFWQSRFFFKQYMNYINTNKYFCIFYWFVEIFYISKPICAFLFFLVFDWGKILYWMQITKKKKKLSFVLCFVLYTTTTHEQYVFNIQ